MPSVSKLRVSGGKGNISFSSDAPTTASTNNTSSATDPFKFSVQATSTGIKIYDSVAQTGNTVVLGLRNLVSGPNITISGAEGKIVISSSGGGGGEGSGATGPTGPAGASVTGPTGPAGASVTGPTGPAGASITGPTGPAGASVTGPTGPAGASVTGPTGPAGASVTGPTGAASTVTGPTGPAGASVTGPTGPAGADSVVPGPTGPAGAASTVTGPTGPVGADSTVPGPTGPTGPAGENAQSANIWMYTADTDDVSGTAPSGKIYWNDATQTDATILALSHITSDSIDIDVFLALISINNQIIIQDATDSSNFQSWIVSGLTTIHSNSYVEIPVTFATSGGTGTSGFLSDDQLIIASFSIGQIGPTGPAGASVTGPTGPAGAASTVTGPTGPGGTGSVGATGPTGPAGGDSVVPGPTGPTGPAGAASTVTGPTGPTGPASTVVRQVAVSLSSADILALNTTPVTIVPAPGVGFWIKPIMVVFNVSTGSTLYSGGTSANLYYTNSSGSSIGTAVTTAFTGGVGNTTKMQLFTLNTSVTYATPSLLDNAPLVITATTAFTTGNGTAVVVIDYLVLPTP
jgi:hypothetical protein